MRCHFGLCDECDQLLDGRCGDQTLAATAEKQCVRRAAHSLVERASRRVARILLARPTSSRTPRRVWRATQDRYEQPDRHRSEIISFRSVLCRILYGWTRAAVRCAGSLSVGSCPSPQRFRGCRSRIATPRVSNSSPSTTLFITLAKYSRAESTISAVLSMVCGFGRSEPKLVCALRFEIQCQAPRATPVNR